MSPKTFAHSAFIVLSSLILFAGCSFSTGTSTDESTSDTSADTSYESTEDPLDLYDDSFYGDEFSYAQLPDGTHYIFACNVSSSDGICDYGSIYVSLGLISSFSTDSGDFLYIQEEICDDIGCVMIDGNNDEWYFDYTF